MGHRTGASRDAFLATLDYLHFLIHVWPVYETFTQPFHSATTGFSGLLRGDWNHHAILKQAALLGLGDSWEFHLHTVCNSGSLPASCDCCL